jgi:ribosomal protein S18 acetylase RimI-like enzyme
MTVFLKATLIDANLLSKIGTTSFLESHGHSASKKDIKNYVSSKFSVSQFERELKNPKNLYYIVYFGEEPAGYSKMVFNVPNANVPIKNATKLERLYVLQKYHDLKLGLELFNFNVSLSKQENQAGMWLYTWIENHRAIKFYTKVGFEIVGKHNFKISETHYNPNHQMLLKYS